MKRKELGFIGLGKMGNPMAGRLKLKGWKVFGYDRHGKGGVRSVKEAVVPLSLPRTVFLMVPAGKPVDQALGELSPYLAPGDLVIDGGNSFYKDSMKRAAKLKRKGIGYLDVGISGGPMSIRQGRFAIMVGGEKGAYKRALPLFRALSDAKPGYMGASGAGHFAKMVHNGIEYGMMQALAEGFTLLKESRFRFSLEDAADVYSQNSIVSSRLVSWLRQALIKYGEDLKGVAGSVRHTGEGEWTVKTAKELGVKVPAIQTAVDFRLESERKPSFTGKILSALRAVFGGHSVK